MTGTRRGNKTIPGGSTPGWALMGNDSPAARTAWFGAFFGPARFDDDRQCEEQ